MAQSVERVALIVGSSRTGGNSGGFTRWITPIIRNNLSTQLDDTTVELVVVDLSTPPHPFGPVLEGTRMPAQIRDCSYADPAIREWSAFIESCHGIIILTPQYNGGYPGQLKNVIDHLYWEWRDKAALVVTFGGHGGWKCAEGLKMVLDSIKMRQVSSSVNITLPKDFTTGTERVSAEEGKDFPEFLDAYVKTVEEATGEFVKLMNREPIDKPE